MEYKKIKDFILSRCLGGALAALRDECGGRFAGDVAALDVTYQYMKDYMLDGCDDPMRGRLFDDLLAKAYSLLNKAYIADNATSSARLYFQKLRTYRALPSVTLTSVARGLTAFAEELPVQRLVGNQHTIDGLCAKHDGDRRDLFCLLWLGGEWSDADRREAEECINAPSMPAADRLLAVSALHLALMQAFDPRRMLTVIGLCSDSDPAVRARACVTVVLVTREHQRLLRLYPDVTAAIDLLTDDAARRAEMQTAVMQLLKTMETTKIDHRFNKEIIPELFKKQSQLKDRFGTEFIDLESFNEMKPEWRDEIEKSGIADRLKEITELQQEGYDIYLGAFSHMKSFTFFGEVSNWFLPFDTDSMAVRRALPGTTGSGKTVMDMILRSGSLCDSDKYSFCLMMGGVPEGQRAMLSAQMDTGDETEAAVTDDERFARTANAYAQDLYRFYKLHPQRTQFTDAMAEISTVLDIPLLSRVTGAPGALIATAETMFKRGRYELALGYYDRYFAATRADDGGLLQKAAYCAQRSGRFDEAIRLYTQADAITPNNKWILSHIASCLAIEGQTGRALEYYRLIELLDPSDDSATLQVCKCLIQLGEFEKALEKLYKMEYLTPGNPAVMRMIGWCQLETGYRSAALDYYTRLFAATGHPSADDHANFAHALWINGRGREALEHYTAAANARGTDWLAKTLGDDARILGRAGIGPTERDIMADMVRGATDKD